MRPSRVATCAMIMLAVAGCSRMVDGAPAPTSATPTESSPGVGELVYERSESSGGGEAVRSYADANPAWLLLRSGDEVASWRAALPGGLSGEQTLVALPASMEGAVAVVAHFPSCTEEGRVLNPAPATLVFEVYIPPSEEGTNCAWSPVRLQVWLVHLDEIGASTAAEIELSG